MRLQSSGGFSSEKPLEFEARRCASRPSAPARAGAFVALCGPCRRRMDALACLALAVLVPLALSGCATLDQKQREWVFQPSKHSWWGGAAAAEGMQDVWIEFDSRESGEPVRLHGLWLPQPRADAPLLLYLHGARWDVRSSAHRMRRMHELGFAVLGIDYRGFGQSTDTLPSESHGLRGRARRLGLAGAAAARACRATCSAIRWAAPSRCSWPARWTTRAACWSKAPSPRCPTSSAASSGAGCRWGR